MPRPSKTAERREQIIDGLIHVMAQHSYDGASTARIAKAAKLSSGLVHYHFSKKQDILVAAIEKLGEQHDAALDAESGARTAPRTARGHPLRSRHSRRRRQPQLAATLCPWAANRLHPRYHERMAKHRGDLHRRLRRRAGGRARRWLPDSGCAGRIGYRQRDRGGASERPVGARGRDLVCSCRAAPLGG
jgi:AcrR family transcriptional regulator